MLANLSSGIYFYVIKGFEEENKSNNFFIRKEIYLVKIK